MCGLPIAKIGARSQARKNIPMDPTELRMIPGTENIPEPSISPRLSIVHDIRVTWLPSGLIFKNT